MVKFKFFMHTAVVHLLILIVVVCLVTQLLAERPMLLLSVCVDTVLHALCCIYDNNTVRYVSIGYMLKIMTFSEKNTKYHIKIFVRHR